MSNEMNIKIIKAEENDAAYILELQKIAYQSEAKLYNDYNIPPLTQTLAEIKDQFKDNIFLKAVIKDRDRIIGTVRAYEKNETCYIGRLAVHPDMQNNGVGTALMKEIEKYYNSKRFELFVGTKSSKNISLYQKLGYNVIKTSKFGCGEIEVFYMEKQAFHKSC